MNLHLTLAFLGAVPEGELARVEAIAIDGAAFALTMDRVGYWPRTRISWLGLAKTPAPLAQLVETLWDRLLPLGFERDKHPFRPHVTLARKAGPPGPALLTEPLVWQVGDVALMRSGVRGGVADYKALKRWPLHN